MKTFVKADLPTASFCAKHAEVLALKKIQPSNYRSTEGQRHGRIKVAEHAVCTVLMFIQ